MYEILKPEAIAITLTTSDIVCVKWQTMHIYDVLEKHQMIAISLCSKLITLSIAFAFLASNVSSANYVLYYKSSQYSNWVKGSSYAESGQM